MDLYFRVGGGGKQTGVPGENLRKSEPHVKCENSPPHPEMEPSPSNIGDKLPWSERAGSNPLNYWLPALTH